MGRKRSGRRSQSSNAPRRIPIPATQNTSTSLSLPPKSLLYLFYAHSPSSRWSCSLYKIDLHDLLQTNNNNNHATATPRDLSPIFELLNNQEYAFGMRCALLGSKLYFLGGELVSDDQHPLSDSQVFPRDVYEFDITTNGPLNKMDAPLNTGKPGPCVFAAAGKIYALGSKMCPNLSYEESDIVSSFVPSIKLFEIFDPIINKWTVLNNPPVDEYIQWTGCTVLERHQQVLLCGWERGTMVVLIYYIQQEEWVRYADLNSYTLEIALSSQEAESHDLVYGLPCRQAPVKMNLDIVCRGKNIRVQDDGLVEMSIPDKPRKELLNTFTHHPYVEWTRRFLRYIGDGHFCYMVSGLPGDPNGPDSYGYLPADLYTRGITITLFKELDHDDDNIDGNNTAKSEGEQLRHSFQAKILHSQEYVMKSSFYNMAKLVGCFVVSPEQLNKLD